SFAGRIGSVASAALGPQRGFPLMHQLVHLLAGHGFGQDLEIGGSGRGRMFVRRGRCLAGCGQCEGCGACGRDKGGVKEGRDFQADSSSQFGMDSQNQFTVTEPVLKKEFYLRTRRVPVKFLAPDTHLWSGRVNRSGQSTACLMPMRTVTNASKTGQPSSRSCRREVAQVTSRRLCTFRVSPSAWHNP